MKLDRQVENEGEVITPSRGRSSFLLLIVAWMVAGTLLSTPLADEIPLTAKALLIAPPLLLSTILLFLSPHDGVIAWGFILTFFVTQTGFQAQFGQLTTSAVEISLVAILTVLLIIHRFQGLNITFNIPGRGFLFVFIIYATIRLMIGVMQGDSVTMALSEYKGFILYPLMVYPLIAGFQSRRILGWAVTYLGLWYALVSAVGLFQFIANQQIFYQGEVYRASGDYGPINLFGITLAMVAVFLFGVAWKRNGEERSRPFLIILGLFILAGALTSLSRTVVVGFVAGFLVLLFFQRKLGLGILFVLLLIGLLSFNLLPETVLTGAIERVFQMSDSSTLRREYYLISGLQAMREFWLMGGGWGQGYWYIQGYGLVPSGGIPWYHNDYLNLVVQSGIVGLLTYLGFWGSVIWAAIKFLRQAKQSPLNRYVLGSLAALTGLLAAALFEHVLWRSDIAGLVGWTAGVLLAALRIARDERILAEAGLRSGNKSPP